jgi:hypothetical protein
VKLVLYQQNLTLHQREACVSPRDSFVAKEGRGFRNQDPKTERSKIAMTAQANGE